MREMADGFEGAVGGILDRVTAAAAPVARHGPEHGEHRLRDGAAIQHGRGGGGPGGLQRRHGGGRRRGTRRLGPGDRPPGRRLRPSSPSGRWTRPRRTASQVQELSAAAARIGDVVAMISTHRRPDQPAGAQRHHRGGARRRGGPGLRRGGGRGQGTRQPDRPGHRGDQRPDRPHPGLHRPGRDRDRGHQRARSARSADVATSIAAAVEEQGAATQEIVRNVAEAATGTGEVTTNIAGRRRSGRGDGRGRVPGPGLGLRALARSRASRAGTGTLPRHRPGGLTGPGAGGTRKPSRATGPPVRERPSAGRRTVRPTWGKVVRPRGRPRCERLGPR